MGQDSDVGFTKSVDRVSLHIILKELCGEGNHARRTCYGYFQYTRKRNFEADSKEREARERSSLTLTDAAMRLTSDATYAT